MYFSGTRAPHLAGCDNDVDRIAPSLHVLDKVLQCNSNFVDVLTQDEFWTQFERRYNKNPDLEDDFIKEYIYNTLKCLPITSQALSHSVFQQERFQSIGNLCSKGCVANCGKCQRYLTISHYSHVITDSNHRNGCKW